MTAAAPERDLGRVYADGRIRLSGLLKGIGPEDADRPVLACPGWSVADVVAHLVGTCHDIVQGNVEGLATPEWTARQVHDRRGRPVEEMIDEWLGLAGRLEGQAHRFPPHGAAQWVMDLTTHEHDVRGALGCPGARASAGVSVGLGFLIELGLSSAIRARGLEPLVVDTGQARFVAGRSDGSGDGSAQPTIAGTASVQADAFELFRALTGRRSRRQIAAFGWSGDAGRHLDAFEFGPFRLRSDDLRE